MVSFIYTVKAKAGLHARPASQLVMQAKQYPANTIMVQKNGKQANATHIISIMSLGARKGDTVEFAVSGSNEQEVARQLLDFCEKNI